MNEMNLIAKKCTPCQGGIPAMSCDMAERYVTDVPGWELLDNAQS